MAESSERVLSNKTTNTGNSSILDCAVCLQSCIHPAELPCGHIFCYLCIKGIVNHGRRCAMCRQDIPVDYLDKPLLLKPMDAETTSEGFEDGHLWFYEGHNGWWQYDDRTSLVLESAYQKGERCCELLIAGFLYVVDFDGMLQYRRKDPSRRRRIKRDIATTSKKGIAGLKATKSCNARLLNPLENGPDELNQNILSSNPPDINSSLRNLSSSSNISAQHPNLDQSNHSNQSLVEFNLLEHSFPNCGRASTSNSGLDFEDNSSRTDYNLDSNVQNTLDWAIDQIESLNLELVNDYENIFRDYRQSESTSNLSRRHTTSNYLTRYLTVNNSLSRSNEASSHSHSQSNGFIGNVSLETPAPTSNKTTGVCCGINDTEATSSTQTLAVSPPQPPPRNRGMLRSRSVSGRDVSIGSQNLNCDRFFQKFVSNK